MTDKIKKYLDKEIQRTMGKVKRFFSNRSRAIIWNLGTNTKC